MKKILFACCVLSLISLSALADQSPIKSCSTLIQDPDGTKTVQTLIEVFKNPDFTFSSKITQTLNGQTGSYTDTAQVSDYTVRAGLNGNINDDATIDSLNLAEKLITEAMAVTQDPELAKTQNAGLDLSAVRSARVYQIGAATNMGLAAIVEAKDPNGKDLGSFFGGMLVSPCK